MNVRCTIRNVTVSGDVILHSFYQCVADSTIVLIFTFLHLSMLSFPSSFCRFMCVKVLETQSIFLYITAKDRPLDTFASALRHVHLKESQFTSARNKFYCRRLECCNCQCKYYFRKMSRITSLLPPKTSNAELDNPQLKNFFHVRSVILLIQWPGNIPCGELKLGYEYIRMIAAAQTHKAMRGRCIRKPKCLQRSAK